MIGLAQIGAVLADSPANLERCLASLDEAASRDIELLIFPECSLSGYAFNSREEARSAAIEVEGAELAQVAEACARLGMHTVVGFLELDEDHVYNTVALIGPDGLIGTYRKVHLPCLAADRFVDVGAFQEPPVFDTPLGRIGLAICYDLRFPESARTLALAGADIIAQPTNSVSQSAALFDYFTVVRACENRVYLLMCNRPDLERDMQFVGRSQIIAPSGEVLAEAGAGEQIITAEVELSQARDKKIVFEAGSFELSIFDDRRPDLYGLISSDTAPDQN